MRLLIAVLFIMGIVIMAVKCSYEPSPEELLEAEPTGAGHTTEIIEPLPSYFRKLP